MGKNIIYIIGNDNYDRLEVQKEQKTIKHGGKTYNLLPHKRLKHRRRGLWLFRRGQSSPLDIAGMHRAQVYKKITPHALKIVVSQNIENTFFKSLVERRGFAGIGRRRLIMLFVAAAVAVIALKVMGYY